MRHKQFSRIVEGIHQRLIYLIEFFLIVLTWIVPETYRIERHRGQKLEIVMILYLPGKPLSQPDMISYACFDLVYTHKPDNKP